MAFTASVWRAGTAEVGFVSQDLLNAPEAKRLRYSPMRYYQRKDDELRCRVSLLMISSSFGSTTSFTC